MAAATMAILTMRPQHGAPASLLHPDPNSHPGNVEHWETSPLPWSTAEAEAEKVTRDSVEGQEAEGPADPPCPSMSPSTVPGPFFITAASPWESPSQTLCQARKPVPATGWAS